MRIFFTRTFTVIAAFFALFNAQDEVSNNIAVSLSALGLTGAVKARDLWSRKELGAFDETFAQTVPPHGAGLFRLSLVHVSKASTLSNPRHKH